MRSRQEIVHTVTDYYDGPRGGVANFGGRPHVYRSLWQDEADEWDADRFELSPITSEVLTLALEDWAIWQRFELAYKTGVATWAGDESDWGALPSELPRRQRCAFESCTARRVSTATVDLLSRRN